MASAFKLSFFVCGLLLLLASATAPAQPAVFSTFYFYPPPVSGYIPVAILAADFNADGADDLLVDYFTNDSGGTQEYLYMNNGGGILTPRLAPGYFSKIGDFNRDGKLDLVYLDPNDATRTTVAVALGNSDGSFQPPITFISPSSVVDFVAADLDNDGIPDLALLTSDSTLYLFHNDGSAHFAQSAAQPVGESGYAPVSLSSGDFNGDRRTDLVLAAALDLTPDPNYKVYVLRNTGTGFVQQALPASWAALQRIRTFDIDNDGRNDIEIFDGTSHSNCCGTSIDIFFSNANGIFTEYAINEGAGVNSWVLGDLALLDANMDGKFDLAAPGPNYYCGQPGIGTGNLLFWYGNGGRNFSYSMTGDSQIAVGKCAGIERIESGFFNSDRRKDLVVAVADGGNSAQQGFWMLSNNTNNWTDSCTYPYSTGIHFCSPGSTSTTSVHVLASTRARVQPLLRFELWVDGKKRSQVTNDRMSFYLTLAVGSHKLTVVSVDATGRYMSSSKIVTVQ